MKKILLIVLFTFGLAGWWWLKNSGEVLVNPLGKSIFKLRSDDKYKVVGFLPTWMVGKTEVYCHEVTHLVFLGVEANEEGNLVWDVQGKKIDSEEFKQQKAEIHRCSNRNILGIKLFDDNKIKQLMASDKAKTTLVNQIKSTIDDYGFDGVNIDFEYQGNPTGVLEDEFNSFILELKAADIGEISMDVFVNTLLRGRTEGVKRMIENVDYVVIMAYDFHRPGVDFAGPVAPIGAPIGDRSILELMEKVISLNLNKSKIVLAYPLYGYEWKTESSDFGSKVVRGWYALASYKRMKEFVINNPEVKVNWDETSMTPWIVYAENGETKQIYFENMDSLKRKFELIKNNQIGGVGFWALGYEGNNKEVWQEIAKLLK